MAIYFIFYILYNIVIMISNLFYFTSGIIIAQEFNQHIPNVKNSISHILINYNNPNFSTFNYLNSLFNNTKK